MELIKELIRIILLTIEKTGPTLGAIFAVYLTYRYAKKQKLLENKAEEHKKVRIVISNLLQIWNELSIIEYYISSEDHYAKMVFKNSQFAASYFKINTARIDEFKALFNVSAEKLKSINILLFYQLSREFKSFDRSFQYFISPENYNKINEQEMKEVLENYLKDIVRSIEIVIIESAKHLNDDESTQIKKIIKEHHDSLKGTIFDFEVPKFLIDLTNKLMPIVEPITQEEAQILYSDHCFQMVLSKLAPIYIPFFKENPILLLQQLIQIAKNPEYVNNQIKNDDLILQIELTEKENEMLKNNLAFYKIICGLIKKFTPKIPFEYKRFLLCINNGSVDLRGEIEMKKLRIYAKRSMEGNSEEDYIITDKFSEE